MLKQWLHISEYCYIAKNEYGALRIVICPRNLRLDRAELNEARRRLEALPTEKFREQALLVDPEYDYMRGGKVVAVGRTLKRRMVKKRLSKRFKPIQSGEVFVDRKVHRRILKILSNGKEVAHTLRAIHPRDEKRLPKGSKVIKPGEVVLDEKSRKKLEELLPSRERFKPGKGLWRFKPGNAWSSADRESQQSYFNSLADSAQRATPGKVRRQVAYDWVRSRFTGLRKTGLSANKCYGRILQELPKLEPGHPAFMLRKIKTPEGIRQIVRPAVRKSSSKTL